MSEYTEFIGLRISETQYEKIEQSGMTTSEFIRMAIDNVNNEDIPLINICQQEILKELQEKIIKQCDEFEQENVKQIVKQKQVFLDVIVKLLNNCLTNSKKKKWKC